MVCLREEKYTHDQYGSAFRPLTFLHFTRLLRGGIPTQIPIHEEYEWRIKNKGIHLFFSKKVESAINSIIDCDKNPENYPNWTIDTFLQSVNDLKEKIEDEIPSIK